MPFLKEAILHYMKITVLQYFLGMNFAPGLKDYNLLYIVNRRKLTGIKYAQ